MTQVYTLPLPFERNKKTKESIDPEQPYLDKLIKLLSQDLDFHEYNSGYTSHNFHSFPAKFPPQLPRAFIDVLTEKGDIVLDPMVGSGTTLVEAYLSDRQAMGFDIDPLALMLTRVKVTPLDPEVVRQWGYRILQNAATALKQDWEVLEEALKHRWRSKTRKFVNYWFAHETQIALLALIREIEKIEDQTLKAFFELIFSATIITKSSGVSLAFDLAHTRPQRAKIVYNEHGEIILGQDIVDDPSPRAKFLTKTLNSPLESFQKRFKQNLASLQMASKGKLPPILTFGNAQRLSLRENSIDLIVTSPPYAANAIDYMRAHKFSLIWFRHAIGDLSQKRGEYIGGEAITGVDYKDLPPKTSEIVAEISDVDEKKGKVLHRYYSEVTSILTEMLRVLKPGKAAIVVVGSSTMRGKDTKADVCLKDIGEAIGFQVPKIGVRYIDRDRRMMPTGNKVNSDSQIQQRMHEEYVLGFYKPQH
ncbi:MAG: DNA methyltransferase [Anaerolineales bacterium]